MTSDQIIASLREKADRLDRFFGTMSDDGKAPRIDRTLMLEAAATIERLSDWMAEIQMNAHEWMAAHDRLKAGRPYDFPKPAPLPERGVLIRLVEESLYHLRLDDGAKAYHERALAALTKEKSDAG